MIAATHGPEFTPPPEPGVTRSVGLALMAHVVLLLALSWGVQWKRDDTTIAVEAELWSAAVQQAAPKAVEAPPPPPPVVQAPPPPPAPAPPQQREADIALERAKQEKALKDEAERQRQLAERRRQDDLRKQDQARKEADARKQEQAKKAADDRKQEVARKAAEERKRAEQTVVREKQQQEERLAKQRDENLKRMQGLAGATGGENATGTALRSSGPSDSYAGRIRGRVKPNIVFTDDIQGNPTAVVTVKLAPDGTIVDARVTKSSGLKTWDDAVLRALDRTAVLPRDTDGRVHTPMELVFRPRD